MSTIRPRDRREFDVVLYGASGFVGRRTVAYFAARAHGLRWAVAGRSADKLRQALASAGAADVPIVVADAHDSPALAALAARTRVVLSTAGPFALYGSALVDACVAHRAHFVDITGETPWVRTLIDRHHARAAAQGTRIVPCCGFDSVPSDLGAWWLARALHQRTGERCASVKACFSLKGGFNGGTLASALNLVDSGQAARLADPFLLNPPGSVPDDAAAHADPVVPRHDADFDAWVGPFFMAPVNTRVVRRSAALVAGTDASPYAPGFVYQEYLRTGRGAGGAMAAAAVGVALGAGSAALRLAPVRALARRLAPAPGEGPSEARIRHGGFRCDLVATSTGGRLLRGRIAGRGDPGNHATTVFVCESALALVRDTAALPGGDAGGGVLTPATAFGEVLARRLVDAGITVEPEPG